MNPIVIEEILAGLGLMGEGAAAAGAGARATAAGMNDLERATQGSTTAAKQFKKAVGDTIDVLDELSDRIIALQGGVGKYADAAQNAFGVATILVEQARKGFDAELAKLGIASAVFSGHVLKYAKASLQQHDLLMKSYQQLSEFGALDPQGLHGILETAKSVGAVPETMGYVIQALTNYSNQLANVGGTVNQGAKQFVGIIDSLLDPANDFNRVLTNLGYSTEDITKYSASFVATNSRSVQGITKDQAALTQQTNKYLEILTELSELTGVSRDAQAKAAEELQMETQWRAYLRDLAKEPGGQEKVEQANAIMAAQISKHGKDIGHVIMDLMVNQGATTQASAQLMGVAGPMVNTMRDAIRTGADTTQTVDKMNKQFAVSSGQYLDQFGNVVKLSGEAAKALGINYQMYDAANYNLNDNAKTTKDQTEQIKKLGDARLNEETRRLQAERAYANMYQELYFFVGKYALPAMRLYTESLMLMAEVPKQLTPGFYNKDFKRYDESRDNFNKLQEELRKYEKEKATHEEAMRSPNRSQAANLSPQRAQELLDDNNPRIIAGYGGRAVLEDIVNQAKRAKEQTDFLNKSLNETKITANGVKLNIKPGALAPGTELNPTLTKLAEELTKTLPNLRVTGVNEPGLHSFRGKHYTGQAIDVALGKGHSYSKEELDTIRKIAEGQGFKMREELKAPGGPHLHLEKLEPVRNEKPVDLNSKKQSLTTPDFNQNEKTANATPMTTNFATQQQQQNPDDKIIISKLDDLNALFNKSLRVQEDILTHTKMLA